VVDIPEGRTENELWEIFEKIIDVINPQDEIYFDITHSFRSLPFLILIILNYVRFLKGIEVNEIFYGALESLGTIKEILKNIPVNERIAPIFRLTPFINLFDWTVAIERFLQTGNANMISTLSNQELKPLLIETSGMIGGKLRKLIGVIKEFSENVSTCRFPKFKKNIESIIQIIPEAESELEKLKPFKPLFNEIKTQFYNFQNIDDISIGINIAKWCLERDFIQQGYTILRETIINYVIIKILNKYDLKDRITRENSEKMLNTMDKEIPEEIINLWREIIEYRNDINHAGLSEQNLHKYNDLKKKLKDFILKFENYNR